MFGKIGAPELLLILVVVLLLFGAKKLPEMARAVGRSARILKGEAEAMKSDFSAEPASAPTQTTAPAAAVAAAAPRDPGHQAPGHRTSEPRAAVPQPEAARA